MVNDNNRITYNNKHESFALTRHCNEWGQKITYHTKISAVNHALESAQLYNSKQNTLEEQTTSPVIKFTDTDSRPSRSLHDMIFAA